MKIIINLHHNDDEFDVMVLDVPEAEVPAAQKAVSVGHHTWELQPDDKTVEEHILDALDEAGIHYDTLGYEDVEIIDLDCSME